MRKDFEKEKIETNIYRRFLRERRGGIVKDVFFRRLTN